MPIDPAALPGFDLRAAVVAVLDLVDIETAEGAFGFLIGTEGRFVDVTGKVWVGSTVLEVSRLQSAIDGVAPGGAIGLRFFQDPEAPDVVAALRARGPDYLQGRAIRFLWQPLGSLAEFQAPRLPPQPWLRRTMRRVSYSATGAQDRAIRVDFESWAEDRRAARRLTLDPAGHARLIGAPNPSLAFRPTDDLEEEKLFG